MQTVCNTYWDAGKGNLTAQNTRKSFGVRGSIPDPAEGAYSAPANPLVSGGGAGCRLSPPQEPHPPALGLSGLASSTTTPKLVPTPLVRVTSRCEPSDTPRQRVCSIQRLFNSNNFAESVASADVCGFGRCFRRLF